MWLEVGWITTACFRPRKYQAGHEHRGSDVVEQVQIEAFRAQISLASQLGMPLFVHQRDAHEDFVNIVESCQPNLPELVVHCFTGRSAAAARIELMGVTVTVSCTSTSAWDSTSRWLGQCACSEEAQHCVP